MFLAPAMAISFRRQTGVAPSIDGYGEHSVRKTTQLYPHTVLAMTSLPVDVVTLYRCPLSANVAALFEQIYTSSPFVRLQVNTCWYEPCFHLSVE